MKTVNAEKKSKFSLGGVSVVPVKSGERMTTESVAIVETSAQLNKFRINKLASEMLNVVSGDRVKIFITGMKTMDGKYLIAKGVEKDTTSAKVISPTKSEGYGSLLFNYSGVWSRMVQCDNPDAQEKNSAYFVEAGEAIENKTKTSIYLKRKCLYQLEEIEDITEETPLVDPITGIEYTKVFALVSPKAEDFTPRAKDEDELDEEINEVDLNNESAE